MLGLSALLVRVAPVDSDYRVVPQAKQNMRVAQVFCTTKCKSPACWGFKAAVEDGAG